MTEFKGKRTSRAVVVNHLKYVEWLDGTPNALNVEPGPSGSEGCKNDAHLIHCVSVIEV